MKRLSQVLASLLFLLPLLSVIFPIFVFSIFLWFYLRGPYSLRKLFSLSKNVVAWEKHQRLYEDLMFWFSFSLAFALLPIVLVVEFNLMRGSSVISLKDFTGHELPAASVGLLGELVGDLSRRGGSGLLKLLAMTIATLLMIFNTFFFVAVSIGSYDINENSLLTISLSMFILTVLIGFVIKGLVSWYEEKNEVKNEEKNEEKIRQLRTQIQRLGTELHRYQKTFGKLQ